MSHYRDQVTIFLRQARLPGVLTECALVHPSVPTAVRTRSGVYPWSQVIQSLTKWFAPRMHTIEVFLICFFSESESFASLAFLATSALNVQALQTSNQTARSHQVNLNSISPHSLSLAVAWEGKSAASRRRSKVPCLEQLRARIESMWSGCAPSS